VSDHLLEDYPTIEELADELGCHPKTIRRKLHEVGSAWAYMIWAGKIRVYRPSVKADFAASTKSNNPRRLVAAE
jgi:hypothetical protein